MVVAGVAPVPDETFVARDLDQLRSRGWEVTIRGLNQRRPASRAAASPITCSASFYTAESRGTVGDAPPAAQIGAFLVIRGIMRRALRLWSRPMQVLALIRSRRLIERVAVDATSADLMLAHFAWLTADVAAVAARAAKKPWVCAVHAWDVFAHPPAILRARLRDAAGVVACSEAARQAVTAAGIPAGRVYLVHHGLPLGEYTFRSVQPDAGAPMVAVGRLERKKGFDLLLHAFAAMTESAGAAAARLVIVGDGSERTALQKLAQRLGLDGRVDFAGQLGHAATRCAVRAAVMLVLPSRRTRRGDRDGIANVLIEAMALGVPVVTTTAGGAAEVIRDDVSGLLVPPDDVPALTRALMALTTDGQRRERLALAARAAVEEHFDARKTGLDLDLFLRAAARSPSKG